MNVETVARAKAGACQVAWCASARRQLLRHSVLVTGLVIGSAAAAQTTTPPTAPLAGKQVAFVFAGAVTQVTKGAARAGQLFCIRIAFDGRRAKVGTNKADQVSYYEGITRVEVVWPDARQTAVDPTTNNPSASNALHTNPQQAAWSTVTQVFATAALATTFQLQLRTPTQSVFLRRPDMEFTGRLSSTPEACG